MHIFSKDYTICIKDKLGSIAILSLEGDLRVERSQVKSAFGLDLGKGVVLVFIKPIPITINK